MPAPKVGDGITLYHYSDRSPGTITRVSPSGKTFWYKPDIATRIDGNGMSESQEYTFKTDETASESPVRLTKNGWRCSVNGCSVGIGRREKYHDFSF